ncbi:MAG TPA: hypothetical protein VHR84_16065 [Terriglobales bacterium]|jgi:hypothetical protein|nr:hypothetical protein [Terriglobales bacterium]
MHRRFDMRVYVLRDVGLVEIESEWTTRDREGSVIQGKRRVFLIQGSRQKTGAGTGAQSDQ